MMSKINVISREQTLEGERIRYIEYNKIKYFIYTLNEQDEEGYEKLYINKIVDNEEDLIIDSEWEDLKKKIPSIVKQIKNNKITEFIDLNVSDINKLDLDYSRAFKLKTNIVETIKKEEVDLNSELNSLLDELNAQEKSLNQLDSFLDNVDKNVEAPINPDKRKDAEIEDLKKQLEEQKQLLNKQKQINIELKNRLKKSELRANKFKLKLDKIKIMIEQS